MEETTKSLDLDLSVTRSCMNCHRRKVRCDKELPCATCVRTQTQCIYPELEKKKRSKRMPVSAILSRLAQLEKKVSTMSKTEDEGSRHGSLSGSKNASPMSPDWRRPLSEADMLLSSGGQTRYFSDAMMASIATDVRD